MKRRRSREGVPARRPERRASGRGPTVTVGDTLEAVALLEEPAWSESDVAELQEFMGCERGARHADPDFRERLRAELWWAVVVRRSGGPERLPRA